MEQPETISSTASSLIQGLKANDLAAWNRLAKTYSPLVYAWCRRSGLAPADVADVAQEVFLAVYRSIGGFQHGQPGDTFRGWLWQITRNAILANQRRRGNQPLAAGGTNAQQAMAQVPAILDSRDPPSDVGTQKLVVQQVLVELRGYFRPQTWQAFWRTAVDEQPATAVGEELGMTADAVRHARHRVLLKLRELLATD
jgi:RNA polymerase sigma-70 factor, ECF subfamily